LKSAHPRAVERSIQYGGETIAYLLTSAPSDRLSISVHPDLRVTVTAPIGVSQAKLDERVRARAGWILKQRRQFEQYHPLPTARRFVSGESHRYLGRQYRLKVSAGRDSVALRGRYIHVSLAGDRDASRVAALPARWYRERARIAFERRLDLCIARLPSLSEPAPTVRLRIMRRRWGSCTTEGVILLNPDLVKAPPPCIDYVIVHELCHRTVGSHSARFYRLLARHMPDWQERRRQLNTFDR
jgi:predicted metal-dependent hydrolase